MKDKIEKLIYEYLREARMMQLATCANSKPWICNVWFSFDEEMNIYWFSSTTRRHSKEIEHNPNVAGAVVLPLTPEDPARGIQFEGEAERLTNEEDINKARSTYEGRIFPAKTIDNLMVSIEKPHVFYRIKVSTYVLFDTLNFPEESRQEWRAR